MGIIGTPPLPMKNYHTVQVPEGTTGFRINMEDYTFAPVAYIDVQLWNKGTFVHEYFAKFIGSRMDNNSPTGLLIRNVPYTEARFTGVEAVSKKWHVTTGCNDWWCTVPEPSTYILFVVGVLITFLFRRRR